MNLTEILKKAIDELTFAEIKFLRTKSEELSDEDKEKFEEVLEDADEAGEEDESEDDVAAKHVDLVEKLVDAKVKEIEKRLDPPVEKNINLGKAVNKTATAEEKTKAWFKGLVTRDFSEYIAITKDAMNTTEDSAVLPPEEFIAEVSRLEEQYGVAARYADVRRTDRRTIRGIKGGDDVQFIETNEGGAKPSMRPSYLPFELTFKKYTAIVPLTEELVEDSAVNLFADLTQRFARAAAKKQDEIVFTHATTGIVNTPNAADVIINGDSLEDMTADDLNKMLYAVPTPSMENGRYYLNRTALGVVQRLKDQEKRYIWQPGMNGAAEGTIWGKPYTLTEVLPGLQDDNDDTGFIVFGDLKNTLLGIRIPLDVRIFDTGTVGDPDEENQVTNTLNLLTEDLLAARARIRMNTVHKHPEAYSVLYTNVTS